VNTIAPPNQMMRSALSGASRLEKLFCLADALTALRNGKSFGPPNVELLLPAEVQETLAGLLTIRDDQTRALLKKAKPGAPKAERALSIIKEASLARDYDPGNNRHGTGFNRPDVVAGLTMKMDAMLLLDQPLTLAMITGGTKVQNPLKVGQGIGPDLADWVAVNHLQALADALRKATGHPAKIVLVADGPLHSGDAGLDARLADLFVQQLRRDAIHLLRAPDVVVASPLGQLDEGWYRYLRTETKNIRRLVEQDPTFRRQHAEQAEALVSSLNWNARGWSYGYGIEVSGALAGLATSAAAARDAEDLKRLSLQVSISYTATNHAVRDLRLVERVVKQETGQEVFLRASVHAKPHEPRLALAPSNSLSRHYLLPMHSTGRLEPASDGAIRYGPVFDLEGRLNQWQLVGLFDSDQGLVRPLFYRPECRDARDALDRWADDGGQNLS
jgi:hypothetical protein